MFKTIKENLNKFEYKPYCGMHRYYIYKNIKIAYECDFIFFYYNLYIDEKIVKLNIIEQWKLMRVYKKLEKNRHNSYKNKIKSELINA